MAPHGWRLGSPILCPILAEAKEEDTSCHIFLQSVKFLHMEMPYTFPVARGCLNLGPGCAQLRQERVAVGL